MCNEWFFITLSGANPIMDQLLQPLSASRDIHAESLRAQLQGSLILPGDADYDMARAAWNLTVDQQPAMIVTAHTVNDVVTAVRFARQYDIPVAVQATGHGIARKADGALLLLTSAMNAVTVDAAAQTAYVQAGAQWNAVLQMAQQHGLAPLLGSSPEVGAVGYTLGGGMGWLARKFGLAADSVRRFHVVTATGDVLAASATENSDLFWGLRGSAGSLGIVTGMDIQLYPVTTVYGGSLFYPASDAREVFQFYREWVQYLPEEWTTSIAIMNFPPVPDVPEFLRGQSVAMMSGCYVGDARVGQMMVQAWADWRAPMVNGFHPMPFTEVGSISNDPKDPMPGVSSGAWIANLDDATIDTILQFALPAGGPPALVKTEIRHAGGAMNRIPAQANAYSHREEQFLLQMVGLAFNPEMLFGVTMHMQSFKSALADAVRGVYVNFLEGEEKATSAPQAFNRENLARLHHLKQQVDPANRLSHALEL
jgi:hypothetical protein